MLRWSDYISTAKKFYTSVLYINKKNKFSGNKICVANLKNGLKKKRRSSRKYKKEDGKWNYILVCVRWW